MKKLSRRILSLSLLTLLAPIFAFSLDGRLERKKYGQYQTTLLQDFQTGLGKFVIQKGNLTVFEETDYDNHYYFGNHFEPNTDEPTDKFSGRDITSKGIKNLVVSNWTGGAHCCHVLHIFELGKVLKRLVTVEAQSSSIRLVDLDHDEYPEIEFWDGAIDYQFASFAGSPGGRVVLKFRNDQYEVATHLMKKPKPTRRELGRLTKSLRDSLKENDSPDLPNLFLKTLMDLSYSGHFGLALQIANEAWPAEKPGFEKFKLEFSEALRASKYWREF